MHRHDVVILAGDTTSDSSQLLHVCSDSQQQTQVDTERSNVCSGFAADPEDTEVPVVVVLDHLALVDRSHSQLPLDGRDEGWSLEQSSGEGLQSSGKRLLAFGQFIVESDDTDVLLSGALLRFDQTSCSVDTDDEASSDFGVKRSRVSSLLHPQNPLQPRDNFVRRWVGRLVKVNDTGLDVCGQFSLQWADSGWDRGEVG